MSSRAQVVAAQRGLRPCHEPADNVSLCLAHCQTAEQTLDKHQVKVLDLSLQIVLLVARPDGRPAMRWIARSYSPVAGPPPRILFRSLLI